MRAARALARGESKAAAAREAGVDRATIGRWVKTPEFSDMVLQAQPVEEGDDPKVQANKGLHDLVPIAMKVLEDALNGADISPQQQTVALNVIKAAKQFEPPSEEETGPSTLTSLIARLDAEAAGS
jgi:hypothetical protein